MIFEYAVTLKSISYTKYFIQFLRYNNISYTYLNDTQVFIIRATPMCANIISRFYYIDDIVANQPIYIDWGNKGVIISDDAADDNGTRGDWGVYKINAPSLWSKGITGQGINVAIIDSGIADHFQLEIAGRVSVIDSPPEDTFGHGTVMAGIIGAKPIPGGITGVAYGCNLYSVKVGSPDKKISPGMVNIIEALEWCIDNNIQVINLSLGFPKLKPKELEIFSETVNKVINKGIILVAASGNQNQPNVVFPGTFLDVLSIGGVDINNQRWVNLQKGTGSNYGLGLSFVAPGVQIESTTINNKYSISTGTSVAAPHVTGLIALLLSESPSRTPSEIFDILRQRATPLPPGSPGYSLEYAYGLVSAI